MRIITSFQRTSPILLTGVLLTGSIDWTQAQSSFQLRSGRIASPTSGSTTTTSLPGFGDPLPNLSTGQLTAFAEGLEDFEAEDTPESGLGPVFNNVSCAACHSVPATGGGSELLETRFGRLVNGRFDPLTAQGGSLMDLFAIDPSIQETVPTNANVTAQRRTTPLFGLGLIEAIPDSTLLQSAKSLKPDNVTGRASMVTDVASGQLRVGRFGWKAQQATLLAFSGDAYLNEVGITSRLFPQENAPNGDTNLLARFDLAPDPEDELDPATGKSDIDHFADFMRFLAPPPPVTLTRSASAGKTLFSQIGCAVCHTPVLFTGSSPIRALDSKRVPLYSDLLLHDMGSLGDNIAQGTAKPREMRTAPLWGLRVLTTYLHDGRATTLGQAIRAHDGEAAAARDRFLRLGSTQRQNLFDFLNSN
jgi:CxxC motif-containing protein (DUF1111 family)